jgi:hypothetical protein
MVAISDYKELPQWIKSKDSTGTRAWRLYSLRARLIAALTKPLWFGSYDKDLYQVDHKYSIYHAFLAHLPLTVVCGRNNLELVPRARNRRKGSRCSITMSKLLTNYIDDEYVNRLVALALSQDDEEKLIRWSLYCHAKMEEKMTPPPPVPRTNNHDPLPLAA